MSRKYEPPPPNSPAGSGGPGGGFRAPGALGAGKHAWDVSTSNSTLPSVQNVRIPADSAAQHGWTVDPPPAVHPVLSVRSATTWDDLKRYAELFLAPQSFNLGVCFGIAESLVAGVNSLLSLLKTFVLEGVYESVHHPPPLSAPGLWPPYGMARLAELALGDPRLEKAHAQCVALLDELKHILEDPKKFLRQLGKHYEQEYAAKWAGVKEQLSRRTLIGDFQAGRITGQVLLDVIMLLLTVYGAAELAAKVASEIPELLDLVSGLRGATDVLKAAKRTAVVGAVEEAEAATGAGASAATKAAEIGRWPTAEAEKILGKLDDLNDLPETKLKAEINKRAHQKRVLSEQLGNEAAKTWLRRHLGKEIPENDFKVFKGNNTVNVYYKDPATGKVYVMEAKGGNSQLGTRKIKYGENRGQEVKQGTVDYLRDVATSMRASGETDKIRAGQEILNAMNDTPPAIEYTGVRGGYSKASPTDNVIQPSQIFKLP